MDAVQASTHGSCLCGAVHYRVSGPLRPIIACHCIQCRKSSGHYVAATACPTEALHMEGDTLQWFASSPQAERGFCGRCGSNLFWRRTGSSSTSIWAGSIDGPTGLHIAQQMFTRSKGDYYTLPDAPAVPDGGA
jgi:hypothetical protein